MGVLRQRFLYLCISLSFIQFNEALGDVQEVQFNTDVLDVNDRKNVDLSQFSRSGFIMPGTYTMVVHVNKTDLPETPVLFIAPKNDPKGSEACLSPELVSQLGLKENLMASLKWSHDGLCLDISSLKGMEVHGDIATSSLYLNIPQAWMEYTSENWDPPSRWDEGLPGILLDYNLNAQTQRNYGDSGSSYNLSGNGITGLNIGPWRLRADWQARINHQNGSSEQNFEWSRYYAYRALPALRSSLRVGEDYLNSSLFDGFRFAGMSLSSDDNMLPPNLRGYAPEVNGVAKTNARVVVSQQGRVLHDVQVAAGPFSIQDLGEYVSGELNVRIEEQDGSVQEFTMNTANIPYLTRPGQVRYKFASGRPYDWQHHARGPVFGAGEFSWGVSNGWSLYGGTIVSGDYKSLAAGAGRDLMILGAISFDVTRSWATLPAEFDKFSGSSYRLSYSKNFDQYDSNITFAGYRFAQETYMSMGDFLDARESGNRTGKSKEMYTISFSKNFRDLGLSTYLNFNHQTYWDRPDNDRYSVRASRYFDLGDFRNLSMSLEAYRNIYNERNDDGMYVSLSMPLGSTGSVSYNVTVNQDDNTHDIGYFDRLNEHDTYQLHTGVARSGMNFSGYYTHEGDIARVSANTSYREGSYTSVGMTAQGGVTLTPEGGALHRTNVNGSTRLLLDTERVSNVPVRGYGSTVRTNIFGKAVVSDVNSYYRNRASIDVNQLDDNVEASQSVVQVTLTEGAIGYRKFNVIAGEKAMAVIKQADGSTPPFGASVLNSRKQETGLVGDGGNVFLSGINPGDTMTVSWEGQVQCEVRMPSPLPEDLMSKTLLLPCHSLTGRAEASNTLVIR
ncbi:outer membrane usher protein [Enterobacter roggenkampii]|uniref:outer membrane usher protein n=1 Tax=Enterobacter roggenkampii TaxID=1812935 RepID=UPI000DA10CB3|nr:outer membrane usher protein [Enterobacter roggenkampii]